mgnify:CR=1 FL=1
MSAKPLWQSIRDVRDRRVEMSTLGRGYADTIYAIADHLLPEEAPCIVRDHDEAVRRAERRRLRALLLAQAELAWREETRPRTAGPVSTYHDSMPPFY